MERFSEAERAFCVRQFSKTVTVKKKFYEDNRPEQQSRGDQSSRVEEAIVVKQQNSRNLRSRVAETILKISKKGNSKAKGPKQTGVKYKEL